MASPPCSTPPPTTSAVLLADHGLLMLGTDPLAATRIGGAVDLPAGALAAVRASMARASS